MSYNRCYNPLCANVEIARLRGLYSELDKAILGCYRWGDLNPSYGFHTNECGEGAHTVSDVAWHKVLTRTRRLNLEVTGREEWVREGRGTVLR